MVRSATSVSLHSFEGCSVPAPGRVAAGLSAPEVAGLWLDFLDVGRMPPIRYADVESLVGAIQGVPAV